MRGGGGHLRGGGGGKEGGGGEGGAFEGGEGHLTERSDVGRIKFKAGAEGQSPGGGPGAKSPENFTIKRLSRCSKILQFFKFLSALKGREQCSLSFSEGEHVYPVLPLVAELGV